MAWIDDVINGDIPRRGFRMDTNSLTRRECRRRSWDVAKVEIYNAEVRRQYDCFGVFDYLAITGDGVAGIQSTVRPAMASHMAKMLESELLRRWLFSADAFLWCWGRLALPDGSEGKACLLEYEFSLDGATIVARRTIDERFDLVHREPQDCKAEFRSGIDG